MQDTVEVAGKVEKIMQDFLLKILELKDNVVLKELYQQYLDGQWKYLLAYDMGCGNTSAAITTTDGWKVPTLVRWSRMRGAEHSYEMSVKTILGCNEEGYVVGDAAVSSGGVENFKKVPTERNLEEQSFIGIKEDQEKLREIWKEYFKVTLDASLRYVQDHAAALGYGADITKANTIFLVAHPAGKQWDKELHNYRKLIMDAEDLKEQQVITFSEAKASMMYARQFKVSSQHVLQAGKDTLIIDIGASTIDIIRLDAKGRPISGSEFSIPLAGRNIDELIGYNLLEEFSGFTFPHPYQAGKFPDDTFFQQNGQKIGCDRAAFRLRMRSFKEEICNNQRRKEHDIPEKCGTVSYGRGRNQHNIEKDSQWLSNLLCTAPIQFKCQDVGGFVRFINKETTGNTIVATWNDLLTAVVEYAAQGMEQGGQIVITGGSANLVDIEACVRMGADKAKVLDPRLTILNERRDYEQTVPFGSAYYMMRILNNLDTMLKFPGELTADIRNWVSDAVSDCIAQIVQEDAVKKMDKILDNWVDNGETKQGFFGSKTVNSVANLKAGIRQYSEKGVERITADGLAAMKKRGPEPDSRTKEEEIQRKVEQTCIKFLKEIAPTEHTNVKVDFSGLEIAIPGGAINSVTDALREIDWLGAQGWFGRLLTTFGQQNLLKWQRKQIRVGWKSQENIEEIKASVKENVKAAVESQYNNSDGFGIPEAVMRKLCEDMEIVLFKQA